jgi:S1-C subfamily serine protease
MKAHRHKILLALMVLVSTTLACSLITSTTNTAAPPLVEETEPKLEIPETQADTQPQTGPLSQEIDLIDQQDQLVALYQRVNPGIVAIRVLSEEGGGLGSGFVFDKEGHIITNFHVVREATELEINFPSGFKTRGEILGTDPDSDIAVLKAENLPDDLVHLQMGDSAAIKVGQTVVAIGNPHGLESTMTTGIISAKGRTMNSLHMAPGGLPFTAGDIIQTDAAINPGNSGGPLINLDGDVIGVNVAIQANSVDITGQPVNSGLGFAISINIVKRVVPYLIEQGYYDYPYLGIGSIGELNLFQQEVLGLPQSTGVYILNVTDGSPADEAGLRAGNRQTEDPSMAAGGDLIIAIDGQEVRDFNDMITYLISYKSPGEAIVMTVLRDGEVLDLDLVIGKRP